MEKLESSLSPTISKTVRQYSRRLVNGKRRSKSAAVSPTTVASTPGGSDFKLPSGWRVEEVPRSDYSYVDKYYYEPGTGERFRSLKAVERYVKGQEFAFNSSGLRLHNGIKRPKSQRRTMSDGKVVDELKKSQLAIVASMTTSSTSQFNLPDGWIVEEVPRAHTASKLSDTYYYEPGTGRKFRSRVAVERYLSELQENRPLSETLAELKENKALSKIFKQGRDSMNPRSQDRSISGRKRPRPRRITYSGGKTPRSQRTFNSGRKMSRRVKRKLNQNQLAIVASTTPSSAQYNLPEGWIVEEVPRTSGNLTDKYYYEPGTGRKFRSRAAVERYLSELHESRPLSETLAELKENKPLSKIFKLGHHSSKSIPLKRSYPGEKTKTSSFVEPPVKVNWVLGSPLGDVWKPFIGETLVPDSVKQQWTKRFILDGKITLHRVPAGNDDDDF